MYNLYVQQKRENRSKTQEKSFQSNKLHLKKYLHNRNKLAQKHRMRIDKFIDKMYEKPERQEDHYDPQRVRPKFSEADFRFKTFLSERERVMEAIKNAQILDSVPVFSKPLKLRPRHPELEIQPKLYFQPRENSERIIDFITYNGLAELHSCKIRKEIQQLQQDIKQSSKKLFDSRSFSIVSDRTPRSLISKNILKQSQKQSQNIHKTVSRETPRILESMHNRTFFKAVTSIYMKDGTSTSALSPIEVSPQRLRKGDFPSLAGNVLRRCHVLREKHCRAPAILRKGQGKLMNTSAILLSDLSSS